MTQTVPDSAFVMCIEKGSLEYKGLLMIMTLRANWGDWSKVPIFAYSPRLGRQPSDWMQAVYKRYDITPVFDVLNENYADYPLANKPISMAHAERNLTAETIIFLDTDILCWTPPSHFTLDAHTDLMMTPDGTKTVASAGPHDRFEDMWQQLYSLGGVTDPPWTTTHLSEERVRSWWITSVIIGRRSSRLMAEWLTLFEASMRANFFVPEASYLREQLAMCAVAARCERFAELPVTHNFPIQNHKHRSKRFYDPAQMCLWHYQPFLNRFFREFAKKLDAVDGLDHKILIAQEAIVTLRDKYATLIGLDETLVQKWRRDLRIGPRVRSALGISKPSDFTTRWR